jgi:hypothetical protein
MKICVSAQSRFSIELKTMCYSRYGVLGVGPNLIARNFYVHEAFNL